MLKNQVDKGSGYGAVGDLANQPNILWDVRYPNGLPGERY